MIMRKVTSDDPYTRAREREERYRSTGGSRLPKERTLQSQHPLILCFDVSIYLPPSFRDSSQIDMRDTRVRVSTSACYLNAILQERNMVLELREILLTRPRPIIGRSPCQFTIFHSPHFLASLKWNFLFRINGINISKQVLREHFFLIQNDLLLERFISDPRGVISLVSSQFS